jgi:hypothetical protein
MASADRIPIELRPEGEGGALRLAWNPDAAAFPIAHGDPIASPWEIDGEIDWERAESVRLLSATFEDGRALALVAVRPRDALGHGDDSIACHLIDGGERAAAEALLSTEYDAEGLPRRVGLELSIDPDAPPLRIAGDREGSVEISTDRVRREAARMRFRLDGASGGGLYEILRPA